MAAPASIPDLTLPYPYILIQPGSSMLEGVPNGSSILFGQVVMVNDLCDTWGVDDYVMYSSEGAILVSYSSIQYALIDQKNVFFKENYVPIP